jgi:hypothetical protein
MKLRIYQVDAFTSEVFSGNPAAVCPLEKWLVKFVQKKRYYAASCAKVCADILVPSC